MEFIYSELARNPQRVGTRMERGLDGYAMEDCKFNGVFGRGAGLSGWRGERAGEELGVGSLTWLASVGVMESVVSGSISVAA